MRHAYLLLVGDSATRAWSQAGGDPLCQAQRPSQRRPVGRGWGNPYDSKWKREGKNCLFVLISSSNSFSLF